MRCSRSGEDVVATRGDDQHAAARCGGPALGVGTIRNEARALQAANLPSRETIGAVWKQLKEESARQNMNL